jgi:RimJ/RimL family protein N-acetyltransferase
VVVLTGRYVRLDPLTVSHVAGLLDATSEARDTYGYSIVPEGEAETVRYVEEAVANPDQLPFAIVRLGDERVVGSTRFSELTPWAWPPGHPSQRRDRPDVVEIGHTFLAASAQRSGANTDAKLLMLTHAFETWEVHAVRIRTDVRNARSRAAVERLGLQFDGVLRADRPGADGTVRDSAYYSIRAEEWPAAKQALTRRLR